MADFLRCKDCKHDKGKCVGVSRRASHKNCFEPKVMTNADRIRAMTDEELAEYLVYHNPYSTEKHCLEWLKQPADMRGEESA